MTDQIIDFIKHACEANYFRAFSLTFSDKTKTRLNGEIFRNVSFAPRCKCSPKPPTGCRDGKRRNQGETALCRGARDRGECVHKRSTSWTSHSFSNAILSSLSSSLCAVHPHSLISAGIGIDSHSHIHTHARARSKVLPPIPLLASSNAEGEKQNQFEQRGKR